MKVRILMITHNRPGYTQLSLKRLCDSVSDGVRVTVWDNASTKETLDVIRPYEKHPKIEKVVYSRTNDKLWGPTNWFWANAADADYVGKVDDDCLMPDGWVDLLVKAHDDVPDFGFLGTWCFPEEDFDESIASKKIQSFGAHKVLRVCWVPGSGYIAKRRAIDRLGSLKHKESFTNYTIRAAASGFINGYYFPLLFQEHMDDPRAEHTAIRTDADLQRLKPLTAGTFKVNSRDEWIALNKRIAMRLQTCSFNPRHFHGWRGRLTRLWCKVTRSKYPPEVS